MDGTADYAAVGADDAADAVILTSLDATAAGAVPSLWMDVVRRWAMACWLDLYIFKIDSL